MNSTFDRLRAILVKTFNLAPERLTPQASLAELDIDSLGAVELLWEIEAVFKLKLPSEPVALLTLADVVVFIDGLVAQRRAQTLQPLMHPAPQPPIVGAVMQALKTSKLQ